MDADNGMLGLVDRRGENLLEVLPFRSARTRPDRGVVVDVAVNRPEIVGEQLQRLGQVLVGGRGVRPDGVAAGRRHDDAAKNGKFRIGVNEGDIGMPLVGATAATA